MEFTMGRRIAVSLIAAGLSATSFNACSLSEGHGAASGEEIAAHERELEIRRLRRELYVKEIGEACVDSLLPYTTGERIDDGEEGAISDLTQDPDQPCGDDPEEIRHRFKTLDLHEAAVEYAEEALGNVQGQ